VTVTTELQTSAYNTEGNLRGTERHTAKVVLRAGAKGDADYETLSRINLPPGRYQLRLAAYHELTGQTGTVSVDVVVPDFARDLASISGVIVNVLPGRPSAPRDLFRDTLSLVPTAQRTFAPTDQVSAMFYLYQNAGKPMFPAEIAIRVLDDKQAMVLSDIRTINVDAFVGAGSGKDNTPAIPRKGGTKVVPTVPDRSSASGAGQSSIRAAEVRYPLSVSQLPAGVYLLTFEARVGTVSLRRDVQFEVRR
jgi:hypothetical protein